MFYKHKYFILDTTSKKVFDENNKELRLTGNAYRVFNFLCIKKYTNLTEIGSFLDWAKDYDENHIRQYRYKINTIVGHDVIEYNNGIYSLVGDVEELVSLDRIGCNTDLLQSDGVKSESKYKFMEELKKTKFNIMPAIVASVLLLLTFFDWPYGYYTFLRFIITGVAAYYGFYLYTVIEKRGLWFWGLVVVTIIFNPLIPIYLGEKMIWSVIDIVVAIFFVSLILKFNKQNNK
jgi:hypothetical protein